MTQNLTIGFIGYGNMAQAIAQGFVDAGVVTGGQMVACAAHYDKLEKTTAELGVRPLHNALEVVTAADVVIIAIKPYQIAAVVKPLTDELAKPGKIVVSIAAGMESQEVPGPGSPPKTANPLTLRTSISSAPFRTLRWLWARACSSPNPSTP